MNGQPALATVCTPLAPDGPPQRAVWWISTNNGHFEGRLMIVDTMGDRYAASAPGGFDLCVD